MDGPARSAHPATEIGESRGKGLRGVLARLRLSGSVAVPKEIEDVVRLTRSAHQKADTREIVRSYQVAKAVHEGQVRASGEPFINHPIGVARILAELGLDPTTIVAAFLHDTVEDTSLELPDVEAVFGPEVALIIDGLTKIDKIEFRSHEHEQAENLRKMIVAMARDVRVVIIKLADRLHNMRTLAHLDGAKQEAISNETLEIYAPLAHRLGMQHLRSELEDLSFLALYPKRYAEIEQMVADRQPAREQYLERVIAEIKAKLREVRLRAEISGRPKHYYSIYEKKTKRGRDFDEIFDLLGVRILVDGVKDCYGVLGAVHALWRPIPGRVKDYIAVPKFNLYQSLHTTVLGPEGKPLEIQIRTREMHRTAEWGVAAHWQYKAGKEEDDRAWIRRMLEHREMEDDTEFLESLRVELFSDEVFVFTPKGDVLEMAKGATPIDFAYHIHTEVGHACVGARVDGRLVPLDHRLASGETVQVVTSKSGRGPSRDWLEVVVTPRARTKIKQWFTKERRDEALGEGRDAVVKALRRAGLPVQRILAEGSLEEIAHSLLADGLDALYVDVGEGRTSVQAVVTRLLRQRLGALEEGEEEVEAPRPPRLKPPSSEGISVKGIGDTLTKLAQCCMPVPGDAVVGFVTRGRGVSVHRADCPNAAGLLSSQGDRFVEVGWHESASGVFSMSIQVEALDRPRLLRDVTTTISDFGINITAASSTVGQGIATLRFTVELPDPSQLAAIVTAVKRVETVYDCYRLTPQ